MPSYRDGLIRILSVNVGGPRELTWRGRTVTTAIFKFPVSGPVRLRSTSLDGDRQADLSVHGGSDKAVYAYASGHYARWASELPGHPFEPGAFGENLTLDDFVESEIRVGDRFRAGTAVVEVSQPRQPCYKLNLRHSREDMIDRMLANGMTGFYMRVIEEGVIEAGGTFECIASDDDAITIAEAARLYIGASNDPALLRRAIASRGFSPGWKDRFSRVLESVQTVTG